MGKFSLGLEVIDFQKDDIFDRLVEKFKALRNSGYKNKNTVTEIQELIKHRFGMTMSLEYMTKLDFVILPIPFVVIPFGLPSSPFAMVDVLNPNHVFLTPKQNKQTVKYSEEIINIVKNFKDNNVVDLKNAKLHGDIGEVKQVIIMNKLLKTFLTVEQEVAIFLHEVGHLFTYIEHTNRTVSTNLVMLSASNLATSVKTPDEKKLIFKTYVEDLDLHPDTFQNMEKSKTFEESCVVYIRNQATLYKSATGSKMYDTVSSEQSADQFVSRLGGGRYLVEALDKLNTLYFNKRSLTYTLYSDFMTASTIAILLSFVAVVIKLSPLGTLLLPYTLYNLYQFFDSSPLTSKYDNNKVRLKRIKYDLMTMLKKSDDLEEHKKEILNRIEKMDIVINKYTDHLDLFMNIVNKIFRNKEYSAYQMQRDLEDIAFNDLFIKAEKLRLS